MAGKTLSKQKAAGQKRPFLVRHAPNNKRQEDVSISTKQGKARTVKEWILGLQHGTMRADTKVYYDNIKSFDKEFVPKDLTRMSRIQLLQEQGRCKEYINKHINGSNTEKGSAQGSAEAKD